MEQFDEEYWNKYIFNKYGKEEVKTQDDLFCQVGLTVNRKPVEPDLFAAIVKDITVTLDLNLNDMLIDFCCGNGLITYELKDRVRHIIGVDFSTKIIETAKKLKQAPNITYCLGDVINFMKDFSTQFPESHPNKYLMNVSLAYFIPSDLQEMLSYIKIISPDFSFLLRGVPNESLKWNYYDTDARKQVYYANIEKGDLTNDGLGRWWQPEEIKTVCAGLGLTCVIRDQVFPHSNYRMDVIIKTEGKE